MENYTLVDVAKQVLSNKAKMEFNEIFDAVQAVLFTKWRAETNEKITDERMLEIKRGELYKLFTIDGRFFRNEDGTWTTIRPDTNLE